MDRLKRDFRHSVTRLIRDRGFAAITVVTLALGIGVNTAVFSLVQTVLRRPLPYGDSGQVVVVWGPDRSETTHLSLQEVVNYGRESQTLAAMSGYQELDANLTGGQEPERVRAAAVTPNLFDVLRMPAVVGRVVTNADAPGDVIVLSQGLWQRRFGGATDIIGRSIQVNGLARTVIGVMPASFQLPTDYLAQRPTEAWIPQVVNEVNLGAWGNRSFTGVARLRDDVSAPAVADEFAAIAGGWVKAGFVNAMPDGSLGGLARGALPVQDFI